ncbi:MAG: phytoene desaturase family protein [Polyangiaceae bacterium]
MQSRVVVVGAGVGGLSAAAILARRGHEVTVLERAETVGGKLRVESVGANERGSSKNIDAGPTVLTMRWALERVFEEAGASFSDLVQLTPLDVIARHYWPDGSSLDLFSDVERTAAAVEQMAGRRNADGYVAFSRYAAKIWELVRGPFIESQRPTFGSMLSLAARIGPSALASIDSARTMTESLESFFPDKRLVQLFGRYATYCGSSPLTAPATLNCISHVEREGVWSVEGGMRELALALATVASRAGARIRTGAHVEEIVVKRGAVAAVRLASGEVLAADRVVFNGDVNALARGLLGDGARAAGTATTKPSLSAVTLASVGHASGLPLARHNVFFARDERAEFAALERGEMPSEATAYVCAQDRALATAPSADGERFFMILNAPAKSGRAPSSTERLECETKLLSDLSQRGLKISTTSRSVVTTPADFAARFPGTEGAIYGPATAGMWSSFSRAGAKTSITGLYLASGSVHPGAGVPMAATSGRLAADAVSADLRSTGRWRRAATLGGTSTP